MFKKGKDSNSLGKPIKNITIKLTCPKQFWDRVVSALDQIEMVGMAIRGAKEVLEGDWHVTEEGYLQRCHRLGLPSETVTININGYNIPAVLNLKRIFRGTIEIKDAEKYRVHFHYSDNNVENIGINEEGLYLVGVKQSYEHQQALREILA